MDYRSYVVHTAAPGWISRAIRWVTRASVSHSLLLFWSLDHSQWWVLEAEGRGVVGKPAASQMKYLRRTIVAAHGLHVTTAEEIVFFHRLGLAAGKRYDWVLGLGWLFAGLGNRIAGRSRWIPAIGSEARENCSEAIATALAASGLLKIGTEPTPGQLLSALGKWTGARAVSTSELLDRVEEGDHGPFRR